MQPLVSVSWLAAQSDAPDLVVLECSNAAIFNTETNTYQTVSCRQDFEAKHIKGAQHADFSAAMSGQKSPYRNSLPDPKVFVQELERLGIGRNSRVVLYDSAFSMWAARLWWMLRWVGFENAAVLDGGLRAWCQSQPTESGVASLRRKQYMEPVMHPELFVGKAEVLASLNAKDAVLIDALSAGQFAGTQNELGISGHITGALSCPATALLDAQTGQFLPLEQLAQILPQEPKTRVIVYCGSGIAAASTVLSLHRLGFENLSLYMPGLQEWIEDPQAPMENRPIEPPIAP